MTPGVDLGGEGNWPLVSAARGRTKNCGRDQIVAPGRVSDPLIEILGDDSKSLYLTVTLDGPRPDGPAFGIGQVPIAAALIEWGNGGLQSQAEIDFILGCTFSVPCSFLRVTGRNDEAPGGAAGNQRLGAFVSYLPRPGTPSFAPQRSVVTGALAPLAVATFLIPRFAIDLWVYTAPVAVSLRIDFLDAAGVTLAVTSTSFPTTPHANVPIPNGTRSVRLTNSGAVAATAIQSIFRICM